MSNRNRKTHDQIRKKCRKCGGRLVNKPGYGTVCPDCGWNQRKYTDKEAAEEEEE